MEDEKTLDDIVLNDRQWYADHGITLHTGFTVTQVNRVRRMVSAAGNTDGRVASVKFKDGSQVPSDLVVMAVGIRPNTKLAERKRLHVERGIVVSDTLQTTTDARICAVGECAAHRGVAYGLGAPLFEQGKVLVGACLYGDRVDGSWYFKLLRDGRMLSELRIKLMWGDPTWATLATRATTRPPPCRTATKSAAATA